MTKAITFWNVLWDALNGVREVWDPDEDEDVLFLRRHTAAAQAETRRLRHGEAFPLARSTRVREAEGDSDAD